MSQVEAYFDASAVVAEVVDQSFGYCTKMRDLQVQMRFLDASQVDQGIVVSGSPSHCLGRLKGLLAENCWPLSDSTSADSVYHDAEEDR